MTQVIDLPALDPEGPGPYRYADARKLVTLLEQAGFSEIEAREWRGELPVGGRFAAAQAAQFSLSFAAFDEAFVKAGPEALAEARRLLTAHLRERERDGVVQLRAYVHIVSAARP